MAGATAGDDGDLAGRECIRTAIDNLVLLVQDQGRVGARERVQGVKNEFVGIREEMFGWLRSRQHAFCLCFHLSRRIEIRG